MHDHLILIHNEKVKNTEEVSGGRLYTEITHVSIQKANNKYKNSHDYKGLVERQLSREEITIFKTIKDTQYKIVYRDENGTTYSYGGVDFKGKYRHKIKEIKPFQRKKYLKGIERLQLTGTAVCSICNKEVEERLMCASYPVVKHCRECQLEQQRQRYYKKKESVKDGEKFCPSCQRIFSENDFIGKACKYCVEKRLQKKKVKSGVKKECSICKKRLPLLDFYKKNTGYYSSECKSCSAERLKETRRKSRVLDKR